MPNKVQNLAVGQREARMDGHYVEDKLTRGGMLLTATWAANQSGFAGRSCSEILSLGLYSCVDRADVASWEI